MTQSPFEELGKAMAAGIRDEMNKTSVARLLLPATPLPEKDE